MWIMVSDLEKKKARWVAALLVMQGEEVLA